MVLVYDTSSECALQMYEVSVEMPLTIIKLKSGHEIALQMIKRK